MKNHFLIAKLLLMNLALAEVANGLPLSFCGYDLKVDLNPFRKTRSNESYLNLLVMPLVSEDHESVFDQMTVAGSTLRLRLRANLIWGVSGKL